MSLPHAILTALLEKPSSGLELARRFDRSIRYFWSATHQQIYRELNKLEQAGLIQARDEVVTPQGRGRPMKSCRPGVQNSNDGYRSNRTLNRCVIRCCFGYVPRQW